MTIKNTGRFYFGVCLAIYTAIVLALDWNMDWAIQNLGYPVMFTNLILAVIGIAVGVSGLVSWDEGDKVWGLIQGVVGAGSFFVSFCVWVGNSDTIGRQDEGFLFLCVAGASAVCALVLIVPNVVRRKS